VRIDRSDDGDERPDAADPPEMRRDDGRLDSGPGRNAVPDRGTAPERDAPLAGDDSPERGTARDRGVVAERHDAGQGGDVSAARVARNLEYRATVDGVFRAHAIDQGYARVKEIEEKTVTPAMRRIEAKDPDRTLVGLEHRLKGRQRIEEKVTHDEQKKGLSPAQAFADMKDAIRYTFQYPEDKYTAGVQADARRLKDEGAEYVDSRNTWTSAQYKGINSWWREGDSGQLFEVQFHTQASFDAKQETHAAYERLRKLPADVEEVRNLREYQREVNAKIPIPPGAPDIVIT
jgi:hypothetical protein